jgi:hypothetical protein
MTEAEQSPVQNDDIIGGGAVSAAGKSHEKCQG